MWAASRMSTGSTHNLLSICRMRSSAEIGSEKITRSMRVRRANSTRSSTVPSLRKPPMVSGERSSLRSSNNPMMRMSVPRVSLNCWISSAPRSPPPTITVRRGRRASGGPRRAGFYKHVRAREPTLVCPAADEFEQHDAEAGEREEPDRKEGHHPDAGEVVLSLGQEDARAEQKEYQRPDAAQPCMLPDGAAEGLQAVNAGDLKADDARGGDGEDRGGVVPVEAVARQDIEHIADKADRKDQAEFDELREPGDDDGRIGPRQLFRGYGDGLGRELPAYLLGTRRHGHRGVHDGLSVDVPHADAKIPA